MKMLNKKIIPSTIATILILSIAISIVQMPLANAQQSGEFATYAYISVAPNPIGVGQTAYISVWVDVPLPSASEANDVRRHDYKLTITAPDGTVTTQSWDVVRDTTGVEFTPFTPTQVGTYDLKFEYPGQVYTWYSISSNMEWHQILSINRINDSNSARRPHQRYTRYASTD